MNMRIRRRLVSARDDGFAMVTVLGIGGLMTALMIGSLAYALQSVNPARRNQDWTAALAVAQAGVNDFLARIRLNGDYGNLADCANPAVPLPRSIGAGAPAPTSPDPGCTGPRSGWANVVTRDSTKGQYHYSYSVVSLTEGINLTVTGRVRDSYRTINARIAQSSSSDFVYYSDFEIADPADEVAYPGVVPPDCQLGTAKHWWEQPSGSTVPPNNASVASRRAGCKEIAFRPGDVLDGPVHTNDTFGLVGAASGPGTLRPTFTEGYSTSDPNCIPANKALNWQCYRRWAYPPVGSPAKPLFRKGEATFEKPKNLVDTSSQFRTYKGCQYFGDTRIRFLPHTPGDPTGVDYMEVYNTGSQAEAASIRKVGSVTPDCGNQSGFTGIYPTKQRVRVPDNETIYVRNSSAGSAPCRPGQIVNGATSGSDVRDVIPQGTGTEVIDANFYNPSSVDTNTTWTFNKTGGTWTGAPGAPTRVATGDKHDSLLDCGQGNVYIEGALSGRVTVAAENNIIITGNLTYDGVPVNSPITGNSLLGLTAQNSIEIYHPIQRKFTTGPVTLASGPCTVVGGRVTVPRRVTTTGPVTCTTKVTKTFADDRVPLDPYTNITSYTGDNSATKVRWIYAAMQTLQHSLLVQSYHRADVVGRISVRGSIAQKFRGITFYTSPVTAKQHGYTKDYRYDDRLRKTEPPNFPRFQESEWKIKATGEVQTDPYLRRT